MLPWRRITHCSQERRKNSHSEVSKLKVKVTEERNKYKTLWRESCVQLRVHNELMAEKEAEIEALKTRLAEMGSRHSVSDDHVFQ